MASGWRVLEPSTRLSSLPNPQSHSQPVMLTHTTSDPDSNILRSVIEHIFMPPKLPQEEPEEQMERKINVALCDNLIGAAQHFQQYLPSSQSLLWTRMIKMMESVRCAAAFPFKEAGLQRALSDMGIGDVFVMHIRAQNAALIVRMPDHAKFVQFEVFEVSPQNTSVMTTEGKLLCSYPGPAIQVPVDISLDECFLQELSSFLVQMDVDILDSTPTTSKAGSTVREIRDTVHPRYISGLLIGILRGFGEPAEVDRITKRIGDEVLWCDALKPWRRSPLWLVLRVTLQSSLRVDNLYKLFMLFFHAHLLHKCVLQGFPSELLHVMRVKMTRRLSKLDPAVPQQVYEFVHKTALDAEALLSKRWSTFQAIGSSAPTSQLKTLVFASDTHISLDSSYDYLTRMLKSVSHGRSPGSFNPHGSRLYPTYDFSTCDFSQFLNGQLAAAIADGRHVAIADFEKCVERHLESWVEASTDNKSALDVIASCIQQYYAGAKGLYGANPEDNSIMILTIMDLWVALDRLAIQQCPLLEEYSPDIPSKFLHDLLLHRSSAIIRALHIEERLSQRHEGTRQPTSIFSNNVCGSFAVKFFQTSDDLKRLHRDISEHAQRELEKKRAELVSLNQESKSLVSQASRLSHERTNNYWNEHNTGTCRKCQLERQAESLTIHVHEWPLPSLTVYAQQVVFELSPPHAFSVWRDITYMILRDIGLRSVPDGDEPDQPYAFLDTFSGLRNWAEGRNRVTIGSTTKSFSDQSHYKRVQIPAEESSVMVNNGLNFKLFDRNRSWVIESFSKSSVAELCTPPAPKSSPYCGLHHFVSGTQHTHNHVIACQADCPKEISLHEFIAFASLRSGPRLQWLNIVREIASPSLSFRLEEVHTLITQAAWQLGPLSDSAREWHIDLGISGFGNALLRELESLLERVKANWLEEVTVRTIALICSRLLASTMDPDIAMRACALLRKVRNVTHEWVCTVRKKLESTQDETVRASLQQRLCMLAATCFSTFDLCPEHLPAVLANHEDTSIAMQCAILVHDNTPPSLSDEDSFYLTRILSRHRRLLHDLEPLLCKPDPTNPDQLLRASSYDGALSQVWVGFKGSSSWRSLPIPNSRWISCVTLGGQNVHYDVLTGQLLIDGKQLGRLPREFVEHPTYASILGSKIFDVVPADVPGMDYMTRSVVFGYQILFSWNDGDLILQTRVPELKDSRRLQFIPRPVLLNDFPTHLIDKYVHWLDMDMHELEFRPIGSPWTPNSSNWKLDIGIHPRSILQQTSQEKSSIQQLIDIRSRTFKVVSSLLSPLESPENIMVTHQDSVQTLDVSLPRFRLSFFVNTNWELECRSMPGYIVDNNQTCGTMFGLIHKLILCPGSEGSLLPRRVIIPQGDVSFEEIGDFHSVSISTHDTKLARWHEYTVDTDLGCLTSTAGLSSKLYQCYLHALTSHCLPDPLLGHTGTEEALHILQNASCRSFQRLDIEQAKLLRRIGDLTPDRAYYPTHLQSMATVRWNNLPTLSQHHGFFRVVCSIFDHACALEVLYDPPAAFETSTRNQLLLDRAASRNKSYYPSDLQTSGLPSSPNDITYMSRDLSDLGNAEHVVFQTSWSIWNGQLSLDHKSRNLWDAMKSWGSLGPSDSEVSLRYSPYWFEFDAARDWFAIYDRCREAISGYCRNSKVKLCFSLSAAAYSQSKYTYTIPLIATFVLDERCRNLHPPPDRSYTLSDGLAPALTYLKNLVYNSSRSINSTPAWTSDDSWYTYRTTIERESSRIAELLLRQWPSYHYVGLPGDWFDKSDFDRRINEYIRSIFRNNGLREHVEQLQCVLRDYEDVPISPPATSYTLSPTSITNHSQAPSFSLHDIFLSSTCIPTPSADELTFQDPCTLPSETHQQTFWLLNRLSEPWNTILGSLKARLGSLRLAKTVRGFLMRTEPASRVSPDSLEKLIDEFCCSQQPWKNVYGDELKKSHSALLEQKAPKLQKGTAPSHEVLLGYHDECSRRKNDIFSEILAALSPSRNLEKTNSSAGLWPRITPRSLLRQLSRDRISRLPDQWRPLILCYATALLKYRHSLRLLELSSGQRHEELLREIEAIRNNVIAESTSECADWLLIQIEANLVARPVQVDVAREMISPTSKRSISLQLNMGEGKSSVIVPLVASTLAEGSNLMRVVTLKPLSNQMFQLLVSRLSGLANRPIFYVPFSRSLRMDPSMVDTIRCLYERCVAECGILVVQPEHILSQKLMHVDTLLASDGNSETASIAHKLGGLQDWMAKHSRDVLDESDEILHVRYQLVYTSGEQMPVDDHPNRWTTIQQIFGRLQAQANGLHTKFPKAFEMETVLRGLPIIRIHDSAISDEIASLIIDDALNGGLSNLPLHVLPPPIREAARRFVMQKKFHIKDRDSIEEHCARTPMLKGILLLRGLLMDGEGILGYVLKERHWRVDYGLDPSRTLLAVPYRAKDVPSLRAEFGHPDVAITLTCLSYYYGGLTKDQVLLCFDLLVKLDNPEMEYDQWVKLGQEVPKELRQLNGVNTEDKTQVDELLVPLFSTSKGTIDFYLSQVVFPRAAREFQSKLPTSPWDLVENKKNITTGFSGTNDNRFLLPTSIIQEDPDFVLGTNALVLQQLLLPENNYYECTEGPNGERESATSFLQRLVKKDPEIRVLLDVGAQMLELRNEELARHWLTLCPDVSAAVFLDDSDNLTVVTPDGTIEPFISSPFNRQLDKCVVYLDEAHTRGTDLKLPKGMRAAVTLGPKVSKDRLVQGCMRMRQLGKGHSVIFFAPGEVDRRIRGLIPAGTASGNRIRVLDVLRWAMDETCEDIRHSLPFWALQGFDHQKRFAAYKEHTPSRNLDRLRKAWLQPESRTLEKMYWDALHPGINHEIFDVPSIRERMEHLGITELVNVRVAEEQEREVNHEVELERQVERPPKAQPAGHVVHSDIRKFVETGKLPESFTHILPLLVPINMAQALDLSTEWSPSPLTTTDFTTTVLYSDGARLTQYLRPVNWILSSGSGKDSMVVVISPFEANELLPEIRKNRRVRLHIYAPRVTSSMRSFSDLTFHSIPDTSTLRWTAPENARIALNLFSGQLYFDDKEEYERVCVLLALSKAHPGAKYCQVDGFVPREYRTGRPSPFDKSKISILKTLIGLRRKGMSYDRTHLGQILNAIPLSDETLRAMSR